MFFLSCLRIYRPPRQAPAWSGTLGAYKFTTDACGIAGQVLDFKFWGKAIVAHVIRACSSQRRADAGRPPQQFPQTTQVLSSAIRPAASPARRFGLLASIGQLR